MRYSAFFPRTRHCYKAAWRMGTVVGSLFHVGWNFLRHLNSSNQKVSLLTSVKAKKISFDFCGSSCPSHNEDKSSFFRLGRMLSPNLQHEIDRITVQFKKVGPRNFLEIYTFLCIRKYKIMRFSWQEHFILLVTNILTRA